MVGFSCFSTGARIDFRQIPYTSLAQCERILNGEINCPDTCIRHKGNTMPRQAQLVLTRMLRIFDLIAKKHGIRYWLYRGTLLGAVRHNGHVPFDTDVDIAIPKLDFEKFVSEGVKELPKDIFFQTEETDFHWKVPSWSGILAKLRDKGSCYKYCIENGCKHNDGLQLDFFVIPQNDREGNFVEIYSHPNWFLRRFYYGSILRKPEDIFPLTQVNFDGVFLPVPRKWKEILTSLYGDFMTLYDTPRCGSAVIGSSCCGVPAQFKLLLVCCYLCIFSICISSIYFFLYFFRAKLIK